MLEDNLGKGRPARQARRLDREEHAAAFALGSGEQHPTDVNAILEESLKLAYHGARAEKAGFNITMMRDLDAEAGMLDVFRRKSRARSSI